MFKNRFGILHHPEETISFFDLSLVIEKDIFHPDTRYTYSTTLLLNHLPDVKGKRVLDLGCGSGAISMVCASRGATEVIAADVDPNALHNTQTNRDKNGFSQIKIIESSLFNSIQGTFDLIFANLPISEKVWGIKTTSLIDQFLGEVGSFLRPDGMAFFTWCSAMPITPVRTSLKKTPFHVDEIRTSYRSRIWTLFRLTKHTLL